MSIQTKSTLKEYFETGETPTQSQFSDFIDSNITYNTITRTDLQTLISDSGLDYPAHYEITNAVTSKRIVVSATSNSVITSLAFNLTDNQFVYYDISGDTITQIVELTLAPQATGFTIAGGTITKTLTIAADANVAGTNTGDVTIGTANGLSLSGQILSITEADGSNTGSLSSSDWTNFNNKFNAPSGTISQYLRGDGSLAAFPTISGTNTGDVTIGTANGLSLSGQILSLALADGSHNGALLSSDWTTFNNKFNFPSGTTSQYLRGDGSLATFPTISGTNTGDQDIFASVVVSGQTTLTTTSTTQTLTLVAGSNVTITTDNTTKSLTINASGSGGGSLPSTQIGYGTGGGITSDANFLRNAYGIQLQDNGTNLNIFIGTVSFPAGNGTMTGAWNNALGVSALANNTSGSYNNAFGYSALANNTTGNNNNAFGQGVLSVNMTGNDNNGFGFGVLGNNTTGSENNAFGFSSLAINSTGNNNNAFGSTSLYANTTGNDNQAIGYQSLVSNTTGNDNQAIGSYSLAANSTGIENIALGSYALQGNTTGNNNIAFGYYTLRTNNTGSNLIGIGSNVDVAIDGLTNSIALGSSVIITSSNQFIIPSTIMHINFSGMQIYDTDAAAGAGGLITGDLYQTSSGSVMIKQ